MSIIHKYTRASMKENKKITASIFVLLTVASALLCALCIFGYSLWEGKVEEIVDGTGLWHGELWHAIKGEQLSIVEDHPEVCDVMVKGEWSTAKLKESERPYLLMRDANSLFWENMNYRDKLLRGHLPQEPGEIVISKVFFSQNQEYSIGDILDLTMGQRMIEEEEIKTQSIYIQGERFFETGSQQLKIVGELDMSSLSAYPGYIAMGYLELESIAPTDELTVYMTMNNPRSIYTTLPEIAKSTGLPLDQYGRYGIRYNVPLLSMLGISDKNSTNTRILVMIIMGIIFVSLVIGAFVLVIYNGFSLSSNARRRQLAMLKSMGATPKQLKQSVLYEGIILWIIQLPFGIVFGYVFTYFLFKRVNSIFMLMDYYKPLSLSFSWLVIALASLLSLITVMISAYIPARKVCRVSAIEGMNLSVPVKSPKRRHILMGRMFGPHGLLAVSRFSSNKKTLGTAVIALSMCFTLVAVYMNVLSLFDYAESKDIQPVSYDMTLKLNMVEEPDNVMIEDILSRAEVKDFILRRQVKMYSYMDADDESIEFRDAGGFQSINQNKYAVTQDGDSYGMVVNLVGLGHGSFKAYCEKIGVDRSGFTEGASINGILLDQTYHKDKDNNEVYRLSMLRNMMGKELSLQDSIEAGTVPITTDVNINYMTTIAPGNIDMNRYNLAYIVPMDTYKKLTMDFNRDRLLEYSIMRIDLLVGYEDSQAFKDKLEQICAQYLGAEDYEIWSLLEESQQTLMKKKAVKSCIYAIAFLIGFMGICNASATIATNFSLHRREVATYKSIGVTPRGLNNIFAVEGLLFATFPILLSLPIIALVMSYMLKLTSVSWVEFFSILPMVPILGYALIIALSIFITYWIASKTVRRESIMEVIRDERV